MGKRSKTGVNYEELFRNREEYLLYLRHIYAYRRAFQLANLDESLNILEVGFGEGYGAKMFSKLDSLEGYVGIDIDDDLFQHVKKKVNDERFSFKLYDGEKIPFDDGCFDMVISFQVIEHVHDDEAFVSELSRVLRKNGVAIITTPNRVYRLDRGEKPWYQHHTREYDGAGFAEILDDFFDSVEVQGISGTEEVNEIEYSRVKKIRKLAKIDFLNLRHKVPDSWKTVVSNLLGRFLGEKKSKNKSFIDKYSVEDDFKLSKDVDKTLDLYAVCRK